VSEITFTLSNQDAEKSTVKSSMVYFVQGKPVCNFRCSKFVRIWYNMHGVKKLDCLILPNAHCRL